jgi:hypothetical protein
VVIRFAGPLPDGLALKVDEFDCQTGNIDVNAQDVVLPVIDGQERRDAAAAGSLFTFVFDKISFFQKSGRNVGNSPPAEYRGGFDLLARGLALLPDIVEYFNRIQMFHDILIDGLFHKIPPNAPGVLSQLIISSSDIISQRSFSAWCFIYTLKIALTHPLTTSAN